ncbi:MAG: DoxX family protein [Bacteroidota bacterium]
MSSTFTTDFALLVLRWGTGIYMLLGHGIPKWEKFMAGLEGTEVKFYAFLGLSPLTSLGLAVLGEVVCMVALIAGFRTRLFAIPAVITMSVAAFMTHGGDPWFARHAEGGGSKEMAILYLIPLVAILILGSGKYSIDQLLKR